MPAIRLLAFTAAPAFLLVAGCDIASIRVNAKTASAERRLTATHLPKSALDVQTGVGSVEIFAEPTLTEVEIVAKVTASGDTDEEAKARVEKIVVKADRRPDNVLEITAKPAEDGQPLHGGCAFTIRVPDADGVKVRIGTGAVNLKGLAGTADIDVGTGAITIADHQGNVAAHTGTGSIVHAAATGSDSPFKLQSGIGAIEVELPNSATGTIQASTSIGSIQIDGPRQPRSVTGKRTSKEITLGEKGPTSSAQTSTGSITITLR